ncbi:MAG: DUF6518 family protein [Dehalococcoidia bacterium]
MTDRAELRQPPARFVSLPSDATALAISLFGAIALGLAGALGDTVTQDGPSDALSPMEQVFATIGNRPSTWAVMAFAIGAVAGGWARAAVLATIAMVSAVVVYCLSIQVFAIRPGVDSSSLRDAGEVWSLAAIGAGLVFGIAGHAWRMGVLAAIAVGTVTSVFVFEAGLWLGDSRSWLSYSAIAIAILVPAILLRSPVKFVVSMAVGLALAGTVGIAWEAFAEAAR